MQVSSIQTLFQNKENRTKAKYIGAGTLLSAGSAFLATKATKNVKDTFKMSNRIAKTAAAGVVAAGVMTLLTLKKDDFISIKEKTMGLINKNKPQEVAENQANSDIQTINSTMEAIEPQTQQTEFASADSAMMPQTPQTEEAENTPKEINNSPDVADLPQMATMPAISAIQPQTEAQLAQTPETTPLEQIKNATQG